MTSCEHYPQNVTSKLKLAWETGLKLLKLKWQTVLGRPCWRSGERPTAPKVPTGQRGQPTALHKPSCAGDVTCGDPGGEKTAKEGDSREGEEERILAGSDVVAEGKRG